MAGGRSQRACELLAGEGFSNMINMDGGFLGKRDQSGQVLEQGWEACGYPSEAQSPTEQTWAHLKN